MKIILPNPKDITVLDCPMVSYKYNRDTYNHNKFVLWILSVIFLVVSIVVMIVFDSTIFQTIAGAFAGGILSLIVWLLTISHQDKINQEIANIDLHIMQIDDHLAYIHEKVEFIDPEKYGLVDWDSDNLVYRFVHLLQLCIFLNGDKYIDTSELKLKYSDGLEYSLKEYSEKCYDVCEERFSEIKILPDKWEEIIAYNLYEIDRTLKQLRDKLQRYKTYILYGNAPTDINIIERKIK